MNQETVRITVPAHTVPAARATDALVPGTSLPDAPVGQAALAVTVARAGAVERLRFGPGVPPVEAVAAVALADPKSTAAPRRRTARVLSAALTAAIVAFVVWFLWPAGPLRTHQLSVSATPTVVSCDQSAAIVATVTTNGNPGTLQYRWTRGDGQQSAVLRQSIARGQHSANLQLSWKFEGPGTYNAVATIHLLQPAPLAATVRFTYRCGG